MPAAAVRTTIRLGTFSVRIFSSHRVYHVHCWRIRCIGPWHLVLVFASPMAELNKNPGPFLQAEYEERLKAMQAEMEKRHSDLTEAQEQIRRLEEQLRQTQAAKNELEMGQKELQDMMRQLEESKNLEHQERERLQEEIRMKQNEVQNIYEQVRLSLRCLRHLWWVWLS